MKSVSFEIAKALKESGYPQGQTKLCYIIKNWNNYNPMGNIVRIDDFPAHGWELDYYFADIPTYLETWLWLWREKDLKIQPTQHNKCYIQNHNSSYHYEFECSNDPEEAIEQAIEYLVENNLMKKLE